MLDRKQTRSAGAARESRPTSRSSVGLIAFIAIVSGMGLYLWASYPGAEPVERERFEETAAYRQQYDRAKSGQQPVPDRLSPQPASPPAEPD